MGALPSGTEHSLIEHILPYKDLLGLPQRALLSERSVAGATEPAGGTQQIR
jgi:hypothetical protein